MKKSNVMQNEDYAAIGREVGIEVSIYSNGEDSTGFVDSNSEYFKLISAAKIKNIIKIYRFSAIHITYKYI